MLGIGAMIHILSGGSKNSPEKYLDKIISNAEMEDTDRFKIEFTDGTIIEIWDDGQSCCEHRYMSTDDDPKSLIGGTLLSIETKDGPSYEENEYSCTECVFVEIKTDKGFITIANYNEHNGYYGGFGLTITEKSKDAEH